MILNYALRIEIGPSVETRVLITDFFVIPKQVNLGSTGDSTSKDLGEYLEGDILNTINQLIGDHQ